MSDGEGDDIIRIAGKLKVVSAVTKESLSLRWSGQRRIRQTANLLITPPINQAR